MGVLPHLKDEGAVATHLANQGEMVTVSLKGGRQSVCLYSEVTRETTVTGKAVGGN